MYDDVMCRKSNDAWMLNTRDRRIKNVFEMKNERPSIVIMVKWCGAYSDCLGFLADDFSDSTISLFNESAESVAVGAFSWQYKCSFGVHPVGVGGSCGGINFHLCTVRHKSSCSLAKSVALDSKLCGVICLAVDFSVGSVINRCRIQMPVANCARETPLVPCSLSRDEFFRFIDCVSTPRATFASNGL